MTVRELIEQLQQLPPDAQVIVDGNSDYVTATEVQLDKMVNQRGYWSHPYPTPHRGPQVVQKVVHIF